MEDDPYSLVLNQTATVLATVEGPRPLEVHDSFHHDEPPPATFLSPPAT